jgi:glycosyltransferase involved in cell wall biosynthesis
MPNLLPFVSVIVPVYNDERRIRACIESLLNQTYSEGCYEILIVDNASSDGTREIVQEYPVRLLAEDRIQSSYAARNKGIQNAKGEILSFTDSDCVASSTWIEEGVKALNSKSVDLVGGKVEFIHSERKTAAEAYDSITSMQVERDIKERSVAKTANLFVKSFLFDKIGMFPESVKSGGDVLWTARATRNGFTLTFASKAIIRHPARRLRALIKKQYRVGRGQPRIWVSEGRPPRKLLNMMLAFLPPWLPSLKNAIDQRGTIEMKKRIFSLWCVSYLCNLSAVFGRLESLFTFLRKED